MAEEASYERGKRHGPRRRLFPSGRPSLEASYEHGVPTGSWKTFYDREAPNLALVALLENGRDVKPSAGFLPDGKPWKGEPRIVACPQETACSPELELLDVEALPPVLPAPCAWDGGKALPAAELQEVAKAARSAWPKADPPESTLGPQGCVERIVLSCAPELDGRPGAEVLAHLHYRIYRTDCAKAEGMVETSPTIALVVLSPTKTKPPTFVARGLLGYQNFDAPGIEGPSYLEEVEFARLPNGEVAVRALVSTDGGDCGGRRAVHLFVSRDGAWASVAVRVLRECNEPREHADAP